MKEVLHVIWYLPLEYLSQGAQVQINSILRKNTNQNAEATTIVFVSCRESNNDPRSKNASFCSFARLGMQFVRLPFACVIPNYFPFNSWELNHSILTRLESPTQYSNKTLRAQPQYSKALHSGYGKRNTLRHPPGTILRCRQGASSQLTCKIKSTVRGIV